MPPRTDIRAAIKTIYEGGTFAVPAAIVSAADDSRGDGEYLLTQGDGTAGDALTIYENADGYQFRGKPAGRDGFSFDDPNIYTRPPAKGSAADKYPWEIDWSSTPGLTAATVSASAAPVTVYGARRRSIPESALPAICVYAEQEEKQRPALGAAPEYERQLTLISEIHASAASAEAVETALDALCARRETALAADETLGGLVTAMTFSAAEYEIDEENRRAVGVAVCRDLLNYSA